MDGMVGTQGDIAYAVFDQSELDEATKAGVALYKQKIPGSSKRQSPHWNSDIIEAMVEQGRVHRTDTVPDLAMALGLPPAHLTSSVERYNGQVAAGEDSDYLKDRKFLKAIHQPPYYGAEIRPATVCFTACGLRIDRDARVLSQTNAPIPGLYAAGESAGGIIGPRYVGSGNSYANCVTFGRIAGASAAAFAAVELEAAGERTAQNG
jgi:fumarate reductase flavoprotein subunit